MRIRPGITGILVLGAFVISCRHEGPSLVPTPETREDARLISLILDQSMRPNEALADQIAGELTVLRNDYGDQYPELYRLHPQPTWELRVLQLSMTQSAADSVRQGLYTAWDHLNQEQGATVKRVWTSSPTVHLRFDDLIHPRYMGELYTNLPGVISAGGNRLCCDWPNLYPLQRGFGRTYLFRDASGDCLAGCITNRYWYFRFNAGKTEFVGFWDPSLDPEPSWWPEAKENKDDLLHW